jgi:pimeloyl-ACP methyl ester carboxylesterase
MISPEQWRARGKFASTPEGRVFFIDTGGDDTPTPALLLHGFPTSSWDFAETALHLAESRRVVLFDFLGFGFSEKPADFGYSLFEHTDTALQVAREVGLTRVHLFAHDMGTSVTTELCARRERGLLPLSLESIVLMNGSVHVELAHLTPAQRILASPLGRAFARVSSEVLFRAQMRRIFATPPPREVLAGMWSLLSREEGTARLPNTIRYIEERRRFRRRWVGALERLDLPALIAWGERDPVAVMEIARALAREIPGARFETWPDLGHYPQVEAPERVAATVEGFWRTLD